MRKLTWMALVQGTIAIIMLGGSMAAMAAPSPALQEEIPKSYVALDQPDDRPIIGIETIGTEGDMIIGTDEAIYLYTDHHYIKTLPHMTWQLFRAGDFVYAVINPYHRKSMHANRILYRTRDGRNWQRISGKSGTKATLFAVDSKNDVVYGANSTGGYYSSLHKINIRTGEVTPLGGKLLRSIRAIGWFQGKLYVVSNSRKLYVSDDEGKTFTDISSRLKGGKEGAAKILANEQYLLISIGRRWLYQFDGKAWDEIAAKTVTYGMIQSLKNHQLVFDIGIKRHYIMDLRNKKKRQIHLPEVYRYPVYTLAGESLIVSAQFPKKGMFISTVARTEKTHKKRERSGKLLRVRLTPESICSKILGKQQLVKHYLGIPNIIFDNGQVIIRKGKELHDFKTGQVVNGNRFKYATRFKQGAVKGNWFIRMLPEGSPDYKDSNTLRESSDRGKTWTKIEHIVQNPPGAIIDDSLRISYFLHQHTVLVSSIRSGKHKSIHEIFEGILETLIVDKTSQVWVQSSQGVFVSRRTGVWQKLSLPFKDKDQIAIRGFARLKEHMAVTYRDQLYLSRKDTLNWKPYPIIDPCSKQAVPIRIVGSSKNHIFLKDRLYGHLWILNLHNGDLQHCQIEKTNGVVSKVRLVEQKLLVQMSGTPLKRVDGQSKGADFPKLLVFHLKNQKL